MNLKPFESLLDELLEDLVAHHEAGLTRRKLKLRQFFEIDPDMELEPEIDELLEDLLITRGRERRV